MKSHRRHSHVTDEHLPIDPALLGRPLATAWRRGGAILIDLGLSWFLIMPWTLFCGLAAVTIQTPSLVSALSAHGQTMHDRISGTVVVRCPRQRARDDADLSAPDFAPGAEQPEGNEAAVGGPQKSYPTKG